jgi:hypothetical protein
MIVNQWVPAAHAGDAVGDHTRGVRDLFRSWGHTSEIFAITIDDALEAMCCRGPILRAPG